MIDLIVLDGTCLGSQAILSNDSDATVCGWRVQVVMAELRERILC